jgi:hypothetical protein
MCKNQSNQAFKEQGNQMSKKQSIQMPVEWSKEGWRCNNCGNMNYHDDEDGYCRFC